MIKIRCSALGNIMTEPKLKSAKEAGELSQTAKTYIEDLWLQDKYGYRDEVITDEILKGILCEADSMTLVQKVLGGEFRLKNRENLNNDYLTGTPDTILSDTVEDIKTSFDISTYFKAGKKDNDKEKKLSKLYEWQLRGYMALTGLKKARLIYCLVDTPDEIITEMKKRVWFRFGCDETQPDYIRISQQIEKNHIVSHIPAKDRVKVFELVHDQELINKAYIQVDKASKYYETLKLN